MDAPALRDAKRVLRPKIRAIRDALPEDERLRAGAEILQRILDELTPLPKRVSFFAKSGSATGGRRPTERGSIGSATGGRRPTERGSIGTEVDVTPIVPALSEMGVEICFPRVEGDRIAFRRASLDELAPGTWGIPEPPSTAAEATSIDVMIVPGVAFDRACRRLGNGKGFYDRAIAAIRPSRTIGVCFHAQLVDDVPVGEHDIALDAVLTERETLRRR